MKTFVLFILWVLCTFGNVVALVKGNWFGNQLLDEKDSIARRLYEALVNLYDTGDLKKGGEKSLNIVEKGYITEKELNDYVNGNPSLSISFQTARDAFMRDYYQIFYIDFSKLTLRVGQVNSNFVAYINSGANPNYYLSGFTSVVAIDEAIRKAKTEKDAIVEAIKAKLKPYLDAVDGMYPIEQIVKLAHNGLIHKLKYTYPSSEAPYVAGVYGIVGGMTNCVGYSTLFKWIMDDFDVPCVLVSGTGQNSLGNLEEHMWNYVQIETRWYAVDVTWDDPMPAKLASKINLKEVNIDDDGIRTTYLLCGATGFTNHVESGYFSPGGKKFEYPKISDLSLEDDIIFQYKSDSGFEIYARRSLEEKEPGTDLRFTYKGKTYEDLVKEGLYLAARFIYYGQQPQPWVNLDAYSIKSDKSEMFRMYFTKRGAIQYCITKLNSNDLHYDVDLSLEGNHEAIADVFNLPYYSTYMPPPFIYKSNPPLTKRIAAEAKDIEYEVEYDDELVLAEGETEIKLVLTSSEAGVTGELKDISYIPGKIEMPGFDTSNSTIIKFKFSPDGSYQSYLTVYKVQVTNATGKKTGKLPNPVPISVSFQMRVPCPTMVACGYQSNDAFIISVPTLVTNPNADIFEYKDDDSKPNALDIRLVATKSVNKEKKELESMSGIAEEDLKSSDVYDLNLGCTNVMARLKTGVGYDLTIGLPYPEGYNYDTEEDVEFKAYHYIKQSDGSFKVVEVPCRISERGLEVVVDGFSPYMVAAVTLGKAPDQDISGKLVSAFARTHGGNITTKATGMIEEISSTGLHSVGPGESRTFIITPDTNSGYILDKVFVNGAVTNITDNTITFNYETMLKDNSLDVYFIEKTIAANSPKEYIPPQDPKVVSIEATILPNRLEYQKNDIFDPAGLEVSAQYSNNTTAVLSSSQYKLTGAESLTKQRTIVSIFFTENTSVKTNFEIHVIGGETEGGDSGNNGNGGNSTGPDKEKTMWIAIGCSIAVIVIIIAIAVPIALKQKKKNTGPKNKATRAQPDVMLAVAEKDIKRGDVTMIEQARSC